MPAYRFFSEYLTHSKSDVTLEGDEFHHLKNVMRAKVGDTYEMIDGMGAFAKVTLTHIEKHKALFKIDQLKTYQLSHHLTLLQGIPQIPKLDLIVEKSTELGATEIYFFTAEKSQHKLSEEKLERLKLKSIAALKQSGRYFLPQIKILPSILKWQEPENLTFYGAFEADIAPLYQQLNKVKLDHKIAFVCGPESGLTEKEIAHLKNLKVIGASLHPNTLRTETAPIAFLSLASHYFLMQSDNPIIN